MWAVVFAVGAAQGVTMSLAMLTLRHRQGAASRAGGVLMLPLAAILAEESVDAGGLSAAWPWSVGATISFEFLVGPLLYIFVRTLSTGRTTVDARDLLHFLPFVLSIVALVPFYSLDGVERLALVNGEHPLYLRAIFVLKPIHFVTYLGLTLPHLGRRAAPIPASEQLHARTVLWLRRGVFAMTSVVAASVGLLALNMAGVDVPMDSDRFSGLALTTAAFGLTFVTLRQRGVATGVKSSKKAKYSTSPLNAEEKTRCAGRIIAFMEAESPYVALDFRLETLATALNLPVHHLSQVLNEVLESNFHDFVGRYRVQRARSLLVDPSNRRKTLLTVAMEAGFNSKASFNRAFKRHTGVSPSTYRRESG